MITTGRAFFHVIRFYFLFLASAVSNGKFHVGIHRYRELLDFTLQIPFNIR